MYTILVAPPGVGKSVVLSSVETFWRSIRDLHVAPTSVTKASLMDHMRDSHRAIVDPTGKVPFTEFHSLLVPASELGVLLPGYDNEFMQALTTLYDGGYYAERRRTNSLKFEIERPTLNVFGATTPAYLQHFMPEGAWNQGFASRTFFIYAGQQKITDMFAEPPNHAKLHEDLLHDLKLISERLGELKFEKDAQAAFSAWHMAGGPPIPDHPKLTHYLTRRSAHLLKLCMVMAMSRNTGDPRLIYLSDYQQALDTLLEAESFIPDIFRSMSGNTESQAQEELWHFVFQLWAKKKQPVPEHKLVAFLRERVPSHLVMKNIEVMVRSELLRETLDLNTGLKGYEPAPERPRF